MATGANGVPNRDPESNDTKGRALRPSTQGVVKQAIQYYRAHEPDFVAAYFPNVTARGYASFGDVFDLTDLQADALRVILVESIRQFGKEVARDRNRNVHLVDRTPLDPSFVSPAERKSKLWTEALRDLCGVFGLEFPM